MWDRKQWTLDSFSFENYTRTFEGHTGPVFCLKYDDRLLISGSFDRTVKVWDIKSGELLNTLVHHDEPIINLTFDRNMLVICPENGPVSVWDILTPLDVKIRPAFGRKIGRSHLVEFDEKYIISISARKTIKVWETSTCELFWKFKGNYVIECLQYRRPFFILSCSDLSLIIWNVDTGVCVRKLQTEGCGDKLKLLSKKNPGTLNVGVARSS